MGFLKNFFSPQPQIPPSVPSMLPQVAKQQINSGNLPTLNVSKLMLKQGEVCHFADRAIYEKKTINKHYVRNNRGTSMPGIFKGNRVYFGNGDTRVEQVETYDTIRGYLYITNKRVIFVDESNGFNEKVTDLIAVTPYSNCVILQFQKSNYKLFVPDGGIVERVIKMIYS